MKQALRLILAIVFTQALLIATSATANDLEGVFI